LLEGVGEKAEGKGKEDGKKKGGGGRRARTDAPQNPVLSPPHEGLAGVSGAIAIVDAEASRRLPTAARNRGGTHFI
jgi:hypothetical protein